MQLTPQTPTPTQANIPAPRAPKPPARSWTAPASSTWDTSAPRRHSHHRQPQQPQQQQQQQRTTTPKTKQNKKRTPPYPHHHHHHQHPSSQHLEQLWSQNNQDHDHHPDHHPQSKNRRQEHLFVSPTQPAAKQAATMTKPAAKTQDAPPERAPRHTRPEP